MTSPHQALRARGIAHAYGATRALDGVDVDVPAGSCVAAILIDGLLAAVSRRVAPAHTRAQNPSS